MADKNTEYDVVEKEKVQYIVVKIGDEQYGLNISVIDNIVRMQKITRVPKSPFHYVGIINLRGEVVPVMSLRRKMSLGDDEFTDDTRIIILKINQQDSVGVIVDEVKEVVSLSEDEIDSNVQAHHKEKANFINGIGKNEGELISLFEISAIVDEIEAVS